MKIQIKGYQIIYYLLIILATLPVYLSYNYRIFSLLMALGQYLLFLLMVVDFFLNKTKNFNVLHVCFLVAGFIEIVSSFLNPDGLPFDSAKALLKNIGLLWVISFQLKNNAKQFLNFYINLNSVYIIINFLCLFIFPNGMFEMGAYTSCYILGYDNSHINLQLVTVMLSLIYSVFYKKCFDFRVKFIFLIVIMSALTTKSATTLLACAVLTIMYMYVWLDFRFNGIELKKVKYLSPLGSFIGSAILSFVIIMGSSLNSIKEKLYLFFNKTSTVSARELIWRNSLVKISESPILGYGYESGDTINSKLVAIEGQTGWGTSAHNFFLVLMYIGGVVLVVFIIGVFIIIYSKYKRATVSELRALCSIWLMVFFIMCIPESHYDDYFRITLMFIYEFLSFNEFGESVKSQRRLILKRR